MSLQRLSLRNFVIVESLDVDFSKGFSVLTGETGAGKSILIDALQWLLGGKSDAGQLREGASRMEVQAEFGASPAVNAWLDANGFALEDVLHLKRVLDAGNKTRSWINGSVANVTALRDLANLLVDIHGQHAWQSLTRPDDVRQLLDDYAACDVQPMRAAWQAWRQAHMAWQEALAEQSQLNEQRDRLVWQIQQLEALSPAAGEWEDLNQRHTRLAHAQQLMQAADDALQALDGGDDNAQHSLHRAQQSLASQSHIEPIFESLSQQISVLEDQISDLCRDLNAWLNKSDLDSTALAALDERMALWHGLARRFKRPPEGLHELWAEWKSALAALDAKSDLPALEKKAQDLHGHFMALAERVSAERKKAAPKLAKAVTELMQGLGMEGGKFAVDLNALESPSAHGLEDIVFCVAGHPGATPKPMAKVASGGELSRVALSVAVVTSRLGHAPTLIFDEIDSGVGGVVAHTVGELMARLGQDRQVMSVTHLPQVAAHAHHHWVVSKSTRKGHTVSHIQQVEHEDRVREIARMLGNADGESATLAHARSLLTSKSGRTESPHA
ncbi:MAG: repair protein RecN [Pseudomonadota bacterium]